MKFVVHLLLSLLRRKRQCWCWKFVIPSLPHISSYLSLFLLAWIVRSQLLASLPDVFAYDTEGVKENVLRVVSKQTKLCLMSGWTHSTVWDMSVCAEMISCTSAGWTVGTVSYLSHDQLKQNARAKGKGHQKYTGARLSCVAPEAVELFCQQPDISSFSRCPSDPFLPAITILLGKPQNRHMVPGRSVLSLFKGHSTVP